MDGAKALVVEVVRYAPSADFLDCLRKSEAFVFGDIAQNHAKTVGANIVSDERLGDFTQINDREALVRQASLWAVEDGEVLHRSCMPILETAVRKSPLVQLPASPNGLHGIGSGPAAFF